VLFGFQLGISLGGNKDKKRRRSLMKKDFIKVYIERFSFRLSIISGDLGNIGVLIFGWRARAKFLLALGVLFGLLVCQLKKGKYFDDIAVASRPACFLYEMSALLRCWLSFLGSTLDHVQSIVGFLFTLSIVCERGFSNMSYHIRADH